MPSDPWPAIVLILITILLPPVGVLLICGCGGDFLVNVILTLLGYFPGHIHAFYIMYIFYDRRSKARLGTLSGQRAPGIFSEDVQNGGGGGGRGFLRAKDGFEGEATAPEEVKVQ